MKHFKKLIGPYCFWLFVLTFVPMLLILFYACVEQGTAITTFSFTLDNFAKFFDPVFVAVLVRSFFIGIVTTVICLLIGYPVAYAITKFKESTQTILILLITFPTWINLLMRTYAWISLLSKKGIINSFLASLGLPVFDLLYTDFAVGIGMVYNFLPFMILPIYTVLSKMDHSLLEASNDLGASPMATFRKITLPLSFSGVLTGITMVFLPAISSFIIPKLLGGGQYTLIGSFIETQFITIGNWHFGSAISLILASLVILAMALMHRLEKYADSSVAGEDR
ncbi:ABC transporter permease [Tannockella kyphosi]|uniref:ABC transporter permease n=1 Tax=Tannockella kyphosi TaxID=2899121 RepID=UPI002010EEC8|nr:ABC transporter permease [Tannockella kyphosi]